ncbi:vacuolar ATPase assembly integral membrane protein VMA21 homolog [Hermetia illucens]|uniref:vacuolar ATPase assembly integral membrane protein VMA21 homolog n=1 Tax=Hermetia illucens TaxID=343691 RepID=UPI0018CC47F1|nr:vacuolar ATPase assembly integral membrane protein VMA21 homolog [Hermetia illucens]
MEVDRRAKPSKTALGAKKGSGKGYSEDPLSAFLWLVLFSTLMFTVPFLVFFIVKWSLLEYLAVEGFENNCWSALGAVVAVNFIIYLYVLKAFREQEKELKKD